MSAEFLVRFDNVGWYAENLNKIKEKALTLETFSEAKGDEFWFSGDDPSEEKDHWAYDVRLIFSNAQYVLVEISSHPKYGSISFDAPFFCCVGVHTRIASIDRGTCFCKQNSYFFDEFHFKRVITAKQFAQNSIYRY
jgi:hypothetical protein